MLNLKFYPESNIPKLLEAADEYREIWKEDSEKIKKVVERMSGLKLPKSEITAIIYKGPSRIDKNLIKLRADYPIDTKKATLIHELLHKITYKIKSEELDEHRIMFLILYDIWAELYGKEFADKQVSVESTRKGLYDYESAWKWALSFSKKKRAKLFKTLVVN